MWEGVGRGHRGGFLWKEAFSIEVVLEGGGNATLSPLVLTNKKLHFTEFSLKRRGEQSLLLCPRVWRLLILLHTSGLFTLAFRDPDDQRWRHIDSRHENCSAIGRMQKLRAMPSDNSVNFSKG